MAVTIRKITVWRGEVDNRAGALARVLEPLSAARGSLDVVMGYRIPGQQARAVIEVWPVSGKKMSQAAEAAGLRPSETPSLLATGDDRPGLGHAMAARGCGRRHQHGVSGGPGGRPALLGVFGFESAADADRASGLFRKLKPGK
jgi:hypothetical protein